MALTTDKLRKKPPKDKLRKRLREENTTVYKQFKAKSGEDQVLIKKLKDRGITGGDVLDIGGRLAPISTSLTAKENITLVEPDPVPKPEGITKHEERIQSYLKHHDASFGIILCSHVLGDLGRQGAQADVVPRLASRLKDDGRLVLTYNENNGLIGDLLTIAKNTLDGVRYDYFNEAILDSIDAEIERETYRVTVSPDTYYELGVICWFLYGTGEDNIDSVAKLFAPKLRAKLSSPELSIDEKLVIIST